MAACLVAHIIHDWKAASVSFAFIHLHSFIHSLSIASRLFFKMPSLPFPLALTHKEKYIRLNASTSIIILFAQVETPGRVPCMMMCGFAARTCFSIHRCGIQRIYLDLIGVLVTVSVIDCVHATA